MESDILTNDQMHDGMDAPKKNSLRKNTTILWVITVVMLNTPYITLNWMGGLNSCRVGRGSRIWWKGWVGGSSADVACMSENDGNSDEVVTLEVNIQKTWRYQSC
jgi:hypothetical protein